MKRTISTLAFVAATLGFAPVAAHADGRSVLGAINTERAFAEIAPLATDPDLNEACSAHAAYMNSLGQLTGTEERGSPLFTSAGLWASGNAVLAQTGSGFLAADPWKNAPFHEFQLMHPWLATTGVGVHGNYVCMVTGGDRSAPNPASYELKTVPGPGQFTPPAETAVESPLVPGDELGLPAGTKTGPNLLVYAVGPTRITHVSITAASLTASDGTQVPVRWVDGDSPRSSRYLSGGAIIVPVHPLAEGVTYRLQVAAETIPGPGQTLRISRTSSFITGPDESDLYESAITGDTVRAASARPLSGRKTAQPVLLGLAGKPNLSVSLAWSSVGVRARIHCASASASCKGPLRILVRREHGSLGKLRFKARGGPLRINLAAGHTIRRTVIMTARQTANGHRRGFAIRWGGPDPLSARAR